MKDLNFFHLVGGVYLGSSVIALFPPIDTKLLIFCLMAAGFYFLLGEGARRGGSNNGGTD